MFVLIICIVGLIVYLWAPHPKATEVGRISFAVGLLVFLLNYHNYFNYLIK